MKPPPPPPPPPSRRLDVSGSTRPKAGAVRQDADVANKTKWLAWGVVGILLFVPVAILPGIVSRYMQDKDVISDSAKRGRIAKNQYGLDGLTRRNPETGETEVHMAYHVGEDRLTGEKEPAIIIKSIDKTSNVIGIEEYATVALGCHDRDGLRASLMTPSYNADNQETYLRWDDGIINEETWVRSESGNALFSPEPRQFLSQLLSHKKLVMGWVPYQSSRHAATFDLRGLSEFVEKLRKDGCGI